MKYLVLMLLLTLSACEDCSKPTKQICVKKSCYRTFFYNAAIKTVTTSTLCKCLEYKEVKNECYFKEQKDDSKEPK
jgi:hypothetical protein